MSIELNEVGVRFGGLQALAGVTMTIEPGAVTALIGPNGAGKSTLVNAITGHVRPGSGGLLLDGRDITRWPVHRRASAGISRTFQTPRVKPEATLLDNVIVGAYPHTSSSLLTTILRTPGHRAREASARRAAHESLERFGLRDDTHVRAKDVPAWSLRLLEVARAIASGPAYILLDEPAAGVDAEARGQLAVLVRELASEGLGVLLIEHNFGFVREVSDTVVVLDQGAVLARGTAAAIETDPVVIESYLGGAHV